MADPRPIGVFDSGVGGLTVLREIVRRSPAESTIYLGDNARAPVRRPFGRGGPGVLDRVPRPARRARRQGHRRRLQHVDRGRHRRAPAPLRHPDPRRHPAGRDGGRAGDARRPGRRDRHARDDPLARLPAGDQRRGPVGPRHRARDADPRAVRRGRRPVRPDRRGGGRPTRSRRCSRHRTRRSTRCCSAAPTTRCCGRSSRPWPDRRSRSSIRRRRPRRRWPSCSTSTGSGRATMDRRADDADGPRRTRRRRRIAS